MRARLAAAALIMLLGCQCGSRAQQKHAAAPSNVLDAREIVRATGTAAPYVSPEPAPAAADEPKPRHPEDFRQPVRGREEPASPEDDPPIPTTGPFAEQAPDEERAAPADAPDAGAGSVPDSGPLEDAGNPLPDTDAHGG